MSEHVISIIGAGNMGTSLLAGLLRGKFLSSNLWLTDPHVEKLQQLKQQFAVYVTTNNEEAVQVADVIILAVKPNTVRSVLESVSSMMQQKKRLIISVAAGVREKNLQTWAGGHTAIVRCMPNTPALIGAGATALYANDFVSAEQRELAESILQAIGLTVWLTDENEIDIVTAFSISVQSYFFLIIELMQAAVEKIGLSPEVSRMLTLQTAYGAGRMALESKESVSELRRRVTSKGGTTQAAIDVFEKNNLREIIEEALEAACLRSKELGSVEN